MCLLVNTHTGDTYTFDVLCKSSLKVVPRWCRRVQQGLTRLVTDYITVFSRSLEVQQCHGNTNNNTLMHKWVGRDTINTMVSTAMHWDHCLWICRLFQQELQYHNKLYVWTHSQHVKNTHLQNHCTICTCTIIQSFSGLWIGCSRYLAISLTVTDRKTARELLPLVSNLKRINILSLFNEKAYVNRWALLFQQE